MSLINLTEETPTSQKLLKKKKPFRMAKKVLSFFLSIPEDLSMILDVSCKVLFYNHSQYKYYDWEVLIYNLAIFFLTTL